MTTVEAFVRAHNIGAGFILTAVGSLRNATIRLADQKDATTFVGKFEIVSLVGTMGQDGVHLHISFADSTGKTIGGHLLEGCMSSTRLSFPQPALRTRRTRYSRVDDLDKILRAMHAKAYIRFGAKEVSASFGP